VERRRGGTALPDVLFDLALVVVAVTGRVVDLGQGEHSVVVLDDLLVCKEALPAQILRNRGELLQRGLQILHDLRR
jgi:hypothetical protein